MTSTAIDARLQQSREEIARSVNAYANASGLSDASRTLLHVADAVLGRTLPTKAVQWARSHPLETAVVVLAAAGVLVAIKPWRWAKPSSVWGTLASHIAYSALRAVADPSTTSAKVHWSKKA